MLTLGTINEKRGRAAESMIASAGAGSARVTPARIIVWILCLLVVLAVGVMPSGFFETSANSVFDAYQRFSPSSPLPSCHCFGDAGAARTSRPRDSICPNPAVRAVPARLLLLCLLLGSSWLTVDGGCGRRRQSAASPGRTGSRGRVGRRGWWRSEAVISRRLNPRSMACFCFAGKERSVGHSGRSPVVVRCDIRRMGRLWCCSAI